jgi:FKBP-type peptidyl-prolyl cis-trans isomerase FkpA
MTTLPAGPAYEDTTPGTAPRPSRPARAVHYTGWLYDPTAANAAARSSTAARTAASPSAFGLGGGEVIRGWDEGVQGMKVGGTRVLTIPPTWATAHAAPAA